MNESSGWIKVKLGDLAEGVRGVSYQPNDLLDNYSDDSVILLRANNIQKGQLQLDNIQIVPRHIVKSAQYLAPNDIAVCMSNGSKHLVGKSAQFSSDNYLVCTIGAFCSVFRTKKEAEPAFVKQLFHSATYQAHIDFSLSGSAINNLKNSDIESIIFNVPPKAKQQKIATILTTIDTAIEKTEALIEKYQQIKAGLMHDLFTRGVLPNGQLRPSFEQAPELYQETVLGWIPKEWACEPCSALCSRINVGIVIQPTQYYVVDGVPAFRSANVKEDGLDPTNFVYISDTSNKLLFKSQIKAGDILSVRTGYPGTSAVVSDDFSGANAIDILISTPNEKVLSQYLCFWINSALGKEQVLRQQGGMAQQHFNVGEMRDLKVSLPEKEEQEKIVDRLNAVVSKVKTEQTLLAKYHKQKLGLMQDLLTGKVSVTVDQPAEASNA
ncbi:MAG TPA: restriction endonuclease subunit S [Cellvibrio sp.]|nr:restriction endonuclease subunit S [Cellvibrio sp.]